METTQIAAWPPAEHHKTDDQELGRILLARMRERQARYAELEAQYREVAANIEREQKHIEHLRALLRDLGLVPAESPTPAPIMSNGVQPSQRTRKGFVAGNQSEAMPQRRPEYASVSLAEAARRLLRGGATMHTDEITRAIFDIQNAEQLKAAKATMRSTLAVGANKGQWERGEEASMFRMRRESRVEP
jgi:hypothetical protein